MGSMTRITCIIFLIILLPIAPVLAEESVDNSLWAGLLAKHVHGVSVDYAGMKADEAVLDEYLAVLEAADLAIWSREERFAYWINVYNAWTVKLILINYPGVESIKDLGNIFKSAWKKKIVRTRGGVIHLDNVEKDILIPEFADARVHFAINCASKSCPPLLAEPYEGKELDSQLDERARLFINTASEQYVQDGKLHLSKIFKWYKSDFGGDPAAYVLRYAEGNLETDLGALGKDPKVVYRDYNWSLNGK